MPSRSSSPRRSSRRATRRRRSRSTTRCCRPWSACSMRSSRARPPCSTTFRTTSAVDWELGDKHATDAAFKKAAHVARISLVNNRLVGNPMEPRAVIGEYDSSRSHYTMWTTSQFPHIVKLLMGNFVLNIPQHKLRVVSPDVGGGFGVKQFHYAEEAVVTWAAAKVGPPGEMGLRAQRRFHLGCAWPRSRHRGGACARRDRQVPRPAREHDRQHGRVSVDLRAEHSDQSLWACCSPASTPHRRSTAK